MVQLKNVSGVPVSYTGVDATVRFLIGEKKEFDEKEITQSIRSAIADGVLVEVPVSVTPTRHKKKEARA